MAYLMRTVGLFTVGSTATWAGLTMENIWVPLAIIIGLFLAMLGAVMDDGI